MAISIPALITSGEMPADLGNKILLARGTMTGHWPNILESAILYANARAWTANVAAFASDEIHDVNELLGTFGLRFGERDRLSHAEIRKLMRAYETENLLPPWDQLPKKITGTYDWPGDPDEHLYISIPRKGFDIELELRHVYATDEYADDGWVWTIANEGKRLYTSRHREGLGAGVPEKFIDIEDAFEDLHRTYEKIRRFSTGEVTTKHVEAKPAPAPAPKPTSKPKPRSKRPVEFVPRRVRKRHVKPATEQDVLRQAVEFGDLPAFPEYEQVISKLVRKKHLQASATEPGAYHITSAGIRALPEKNPQKDKYEVKAVGTLFSLETGNQPAKQTLTIEAGSHDEARKKAASRMVERAELMGYEFSGRHKDFKSKKMNPRRKKPKRNAHIPVQRGRAKIPTTGKGFAFVGLADVIGEDFEPFDEKIYLYTYRKDPQYFAALIPIDLSIKMGEFGGMRRWSGQSLPQWIVEVGIGETRTATPYMRIETVEAGTLKEAFQKAADVIGKDKRAPKNKIHVTQRRWELAEGYATGLNPRKKAKKKTTKKKAKRKLHKAYGKWVDAQKMAKKHPDTFEAPALAGLKRDVKIGDFLKWNIGAERLWLLVVDVEGDIITGLISNDPLDKKYSFDDVVRIKLKHVYDYKKGTKKSVKRAEGFLDELVEKDKAAATKKKATKKKAKKKASKKNPRDPNDPILKWFPIGKKLQGALSIIRKPDKTEWRMWRIADAYSTSDGWSVYLDTLTIRTLMLAGHAPSRHSMEGGGAIDNIRIIIRKKGNKAIVTVPDNPAHYHVYKSLTISVKPGEDPYGVVASAIVWFGEKADRIPPVDDYDREELISAVASNWRKARGSGRVANFPHARVIVRNLLGEWRSFPRSENPAKAKKKTAKKKTTKKKTAKKKTTKKKTAKKKETLIGKAHRLWDEYYEKPTKKALKSVLDHLEDMERSTGKRVRAEWRKAKRSARAEAKRLGVKV